VSVTTSAESPAILIATDLPQELSWIVPGALLTLALGAFALIGMPDYGAVLPALLLLPLWMLASVALAGLLAVGPILKMMRDGVDSPLAHCRAFLRRNARALGFVALCMALAGLNMITFMWVKPLLNYLVPFSADPLLARIDRAMFGTDPWQLLSWLNVTFLAYVYHRGWFALMIVVLLKVLVSPGSRQKSALMLTYFLLWSVFGPLVHTLLPAAGPVFYAKLGHGAAFSGLVMEPETHRLAEYLWQTYANRAFGPGAGISAMPSLHIATTAWTVIAVWQLAPRWLAPVSLAGTLIFLLSISLGWHYATDGIAGAAGALMIWRACVWIMDMRHSPSKRRPRHPLFVGSKA
jgi:hypothetical protein